MPVNTEGRRVRSDGRGLDGACVSGVQFGAVLLPGSWFFLCIFCEVRGVPWLFL